MEAQALAEGGDLGQDLLVFVGSKDWASFLALAGGASQTWATLSTEVTAPEFVEGYLLMTII